MATERQILRGWLRKLHGPAKRMCQENAASRRASSSTRSGCPAPIVGRCCEFVGQVVSGKFGNGEARPMGCQFLEPGHGSPPAASPAAGRSRFGCGRAGVATGITARVCNILPEEATFANGADCHQEQSNSAISALFFAACDARKALRQKSVCGKVTPGRYEPSNSVSRRMATPKISAPRELCPLNVSPNSGRFNITANEVRAGMSSSTGSGSGKKIPRRWPVLSVQTPPQGKRMGSVLFRVGSLACESLGPRKGSAPGELVLLLAGPVLPRSHWRGSAR